MCRLSCFVIQTSELKQSVQMNDKYCRVWVSVGAGFHTNYSEWYQHYYIVSAKSPLHPPTSVFVHYNISNYNVHSSAPSYEVHTAGFCSVSSLILQTVMLEIYRIQGQLLNHISAGDCMFVAVVMHLVLEPFVMWKQICKSVVFFFSCRAGYRDLSSGWFSLNC